MLSSRPSTASEGQTAAARCVYLRVAHPAAASGEAHASHKEKQFSVIKTLETHTQKKVEKQQLNEFNNELLYLQFNYSVQLIIFK